MMRSIVKTPEIVLPSHRHFLHLYVAASCEWLRGVFLTFPKLHAQIFTDQRSYLNRDLRFDQIHWSQLLSNNASLQKFVLFSLAQVQCPKGCLKTNATGSSKPCSSKNWCQQDSSELGATFAGLGRDRPNAKIHVLLNSGVPTPVKNWILRWYVVDILTGVWLPLPPKKT